VSGRPTAGLPVGPLGLNVVRLSYRYPAERDGRSVDAQAEGRQEEHHDASAGAAERVAALDGVTFEVRPGEAVALVGPTGSGKSTLASLLIRLLEPTSGRIELGGVDIATLSPDEVRAAVSLVFQESFLFAETLSDNIALGEDIDLDRVAEVAQVSRFVPDLPLQWETVLGERGVTLSGGQRQRVALARALARRPRVLILDDATSAVDPTVEAKILGALRSGRGREVTLLIVAHRLSTIRLADRVVFMVDGRVRAQATHEELLALPDYLSLVSAYEVDARAAEGDEVEAVG
jgi:ABC-type multidrug transport system fused ATPase/permease subunit